MQVLSDMNNFIENSSSNLTNASFSIFNGNNVVEIILAAFPFFLLGFF